MPVIMLIAAVVVGMMITERLDPQNIVSVSHHL